MAPKQQSRFLRNMTSSLEGLNNGSVSELSSGNAAFDMKMKSNFANLTAELRKRSGKMPLGGSKPGAANGEGVEPEKSNEVQINDGASGAEDVANASAVSSTRHQQSTAGAAESPTASVDSDKTVETPQKCRNVGSSTGNRRQKEASSPSSSRRKVSTANSGKKRSSPRKKKTTSNEPPSSAAAKSRTVTRVSTLGPWVCSTCTFENLNNISRKTVCEMCETPRPVESDRGSNGMEIVNIDC